MLVYRVYLYGTIKNRIEILFPLFVLQFPQTYSGLFCVVVNPWQPLAGLYSAQMRAFYARGGGGGGDGGADMPPHVYSIAQSAFDGICSPTAASQSILIT
jgi:myosin heavy subunit